MKEIAAMVRSSGKGVSSPEIPEDARPFFMGTRRRPCPPCQE